MNTKPNQFYAHSLSGKPPEKWQPLREHLKNVAEMAREFAKPFGGAEWAYLAGLWHDLGKYSEEFQDKLFAENRAEAHVETRLGRIVHSQAGGHFATLKGWEGVDRVLSWLIMGHHSGLTDYISDRIGAKALEPKMRSPETSAGVLANVPADIAAGECPRQPFPAGADPSLFVRMLFSCVVDADFLDTEAFVDRDRKAARETRYPDMETLSKAFDTHMQKLCSEAAGSEVNEIRGEVLEQCRRSALRQPCVFTLTVPTGGGKTLSSLAFALRHARKHGKRRIIYVIPYTSIIEQTASVFRGIRGFEDAVVEHHYNVSVDDANVETARSRLAAENWDAPIIVTTAVQFFESLYASRTSRCRKLHNIADSVVIFDEAQCFPPEYLRPAVFGIRELHRHYGVTPVLCTATQPVLTRTERFDFKFREGFDSVVEVAREPDALARRVRRVEVGLLNGSLAPVNLDEIASAMVAEGRSVLCIVNRRDDCRELARLLPEESAIHLSTNMCAQHRFDVLETIRERLRTASAPFFVVSTSLVEAGVDLDFPVVYRALAGLDSIAQAAGRCNREGRIAGLGKAVVFVPEPQPEYVKQPAQLAAEFLIGDLSNLFSPSNFERFFRQRFWQLGEDELDRHGILALLSEPMNYYFRTAAESFRLIGDDWQLPAIAPYGKAQELIDQMIDSPWQERCIRRQLQRFAVNIEKRLHGQLVARDYVRELTDVPGVFSLGPVLYDGRLGFVPPDDGLRVDPADLIT